MSAGWEVGDLALCLDNKVRRGEAKAGRLEIGRIYRVRKCGIPDGGKAFCLAFTEIQTLPNVGAAFRASRFRKIKPDAREACEDEFVTLLERIKRPVSA